MYRREVRRSASQNKKKIMHGTLGRYSSPLIIKRQDKRYCKKKRLPTHNYIANLTRKEKIIVAVVVLKLLRSKK